MSLARSRDPPKLRREGATGEERFSWSERIFTVGNTSEVWTTRSVMLTATGWRATREKLLGFKARTAYLNRLTLSTLAIFRLGAGLIAEAATDANPRGAVGIQSTPTGADRAHHREAALLKALKSVKGTTDPPFAAIRVYRTGRRAAVPCLLITEGFDTVVGLNSATSQAAPCTAILIQTTVQI